FNSVRFFFQAEDGIRDFHVTGVQTCALPIFCEKLHFHPVSVTTSSAHHTPHSPHTRKLQTTEGHQTAVGHQTPLLHEHQLPVFRSEERRVGKSKDLEQPRIRNKKKRL